MRLADAEALLRNVPPEEIISRRRERMSTKEMFEKIQELKEQIVFNGFRKTKDVDTFFSEYWMQILDMLDDALYAYLNGKKIK